MRAIILFACVVAIAHCELSDDFKSKLFEKLHTFGEKCQKETGATTDDIAELMKKQVPSRQEGKCMLACMHKAFGIQNAEGKPDKDGTLASMEPLKAEDPEIYEKMVTISKKCENEIKEGIDECETAVNIMVCCQKYKKEVGLDEKMFQM